MSVSMLPRKTRGTVVDRRAYAGFRDSSSLAREMQPCQIVLNPSLSRAGVTEAAVLSSRPASSSKEHEKARYKLVIEKRPIPNPIHHVVDAVCIPARAGSEYEKQYDGACWWDHQPFATPPVGAPYDYDDVRKAFLCEGWFCSHNCALAYAQKHFDGEHKSNAKGYLFQMILEQKKALGTKENAVPPQPAPSPYLLECYGGPLSLKAFRSSHCDSSRAWIVQPFLRSRIIPGGLVAYAEDRNTGLWEVYNRAVHAHEKVPDPVAQASERHRLSRYSRVSKVGKCTKDTKLSKQKTKFFHPGQAKRSIRRAEKEAVALKRVRQKKVARPIAAAMGITTTSRRKKRRKE
jgi:hypothetical protein